MSGTADQTGLVMVILERLEKQRLPLALEMQDKVERGERLDDFELRHLQEMVNDANQIRPLIEQHPEYQALAARVAHLYSEITKKALENEKGA
jgi:hypothetical protein